MKYKLVFESKDDLTREDVLKAFDLIFHVKLGTTLRASWPVLERGKQFHQVETLLTLTDAETE